MGLKSAIGRWWVGRILLGLFLGLMLCLMLWGMADPALASIHTYHEHPGQTTYRSQQGLRDQRGTAWQVTLFKRYTDGQFQGIYLRLVGFPGQTVVDNQRPLVIQTGTFLQWQLPPMLDPQTRQLPENVGQYEAESVLHGLKGAIPLTLVVPLQGQRVANLVAAPFVVEEWRQLDEMKSSAHPPEDRPDRL